MNIDNVDLQIIDILCENSKLSFKEIGEKIHLTGQAVGVRINKLIDEGIIKNFTVNINKEKLGIKITAMITIIMNSHEHSRLKKLIDSTDMIVEAFKISGDGCYLLRVETSSNEMLDSLLDEINQFANYRLTISIAKLK